jgi:hypothetical protein
VPFDDETRIHLQIVFAGICILFTTPALTLDLNSFRAQHVLPPLSASGAICYGMASAEGSNGRRYWVLELGN